MRPSTPSPTMPSTRSPASRVRNIARSRSRVSRPSKTPSPMLRSRFWWPAPDRSSKRPTRTLPCRISRRWPASSASRPAGPRCRPRRSAPISAGFSAGSRSPSGRRGMGFRSCPWARRSNRRRGSGSTACWPGCSAATTAAAFRTPSPRDPPPRRRRLRCCGPRRPAGPKSWRDAWRRGSPTSVSRSGLPPCRTMRSPTSGASARCC